MSEAPFKSGQEAILNDPLAYSARSMAYHMARRFWNTSRKIIGRSCVISDRDFDEHSPEGMHLTAVFLEMVQEDYKESIRMRQIIAATEGIQ